MPKSRVKISIFGKVQGVGFRANVLKYAQERGITGWVSNTSDGNLIINAEGNKLEIKKFIDWCKVGPKGAVVDKSEAYYQKYKDEFTRFEIRK
jgi:acylphosphatase